MEIKYRDIYKQVRKTRMPRTKAAIIAFGKLLEGGDFVKQMEIGKLFDSIKKVEKMYRVVHVEKKWMEEPLFLEVFKKRLPHLSDKEVQCLFNLNNFFPLNTERVEILKQGLKYHAEKNRGSLSEDLVYFYYQKESKDKALLFPIIEEEIRKGNRYVMEELSLRYNYDLTPFREVVFDVLNNGNADYFWLVGRIISQTKDKELADEIFNEVLKSYNTRKSLQNSREANFFFAGFYNEYEEAKKIVKTIFFSLPDTSKRSWSKMTSLSSAIPPGDFDLWIAEVDRIFRECGNGTNYGWEDSRPSAVLTSIMERMLINTKSEVRRMAIQRLMDDDWFTAYLKHTVVGPKRILKEHYFRESDPDLKDKIHKFINS